MTSPVSGPHFDGRRYYNPWPVAESERLAFWRWLCQPRRGHWPDDDKGDDFVGTHPPPRATCDQAIWIGHASVLLQIDGFNLVTDPVYARRVGPLPGLGLGCRRRHPPGVAWSDLPPIDAVLVSHDHYDHLDRATLGRLIARDDPLIVAGCGVDHTLKRFGARRRITLDWWQQTPLGETGLRITAVPAQHWAGRGLHDRNRTLWLGFWISGRHKQIYFAGDTGYGPHFRMIRERLGAPDLALLPIGSYEPRALMRAQHMNPTEAVKAHQDLGARRSMGIHFATFRLTDEDRDRPVQDLAVTRREAGLASDAFIAPRFGETIRVADTPGVEAAAGRSDSPANQPGDFRNASAPDSEVSHSST